MTLQKAGDDNLFSFIYNGFFIYVRLLQPFGLRNDNQFT